MWRLIARVLDVLVISAVIALCAVVFYLLYSIFFKDDAAEYDDYFKKPNKELRSYDTRYDYSKLTRSVTEGCDTDYDRIRAIYLWLCDNIEYDTSYEIYRADRCYDCRKGVCAAYTELFYHMANSIGIRSEIVVGKTKDKNGMLREEGHAWIFAYTRKNHGILLDPTWGAGSVDDSGTFEKSDNHLHWFNVDPKWMILSHYPDEEQYQLLDRDMSLEQFQSVPSIDEAYVDYGLSVDEAYNSAIKGNPLSLPKLYSSAAGDIKIVDLPKSKSLSIGEFYRITIKLMNRDVELVLVNKDLYINKEEWELCGDDTYSISFMPRNESSVVLGVKENGENSFYSFMEYVVDEPDERDWEKVEQYYPMCVPDVKGVKNLRPDTWEAAGICPKELLKVIRAEKIRELPDIYINDEKRLKVVSVPMSRILKSGCPYTFSFYPLSGIKWAIVNNDEWYNEWHVDSDNMYSMTIIPQSGKMCLYVQLDDGGSYWGVIGYIVN
ncbi:MAG: hypothetical protein IJX65_04390 [Alistipes sp.]|nr:hypothetical protein [Alistipes sp.]